MPQRFAPAKYSGIYALTLLFLALALIAANGAFASGPGEVLYGFVDTKCNTVIPCTFFGAKDFSEELAPVLVKSGYVYQWGFINRTGQFVIKPQFNSVGEFSEGLASVSLAGNNLVGYIDKQGKLIVPAAYWYAGPFRNGLAVVVNPGEKNGSLIDKHGKALLHNVLSVKGIWLPMDWKKQVGPGADPGSGMLQNLVADFHEGPAPNDAHQYIDEQGKIVLPQKWEDVEAFHGGLAAVRKNDGGSWKYGYIDKKGAVVVAPKFEFGAPFSEGLAAVEAEVSPATKTYKADTRFGYIDTTGKMVIPAKYDGYTDFHNGFAGVSTSPDPERGAKWGFIDRTGKIVAKPQFDQVNGFSEGLASVYVLGGFVDQKLSGGWGFIDRNGKFISDRRFDEYAGDFVNGLAPVGIHNGDFAKRQGTIDSVMTDISMVVFALIVLSKGELIRRMCALPQKDQPSKRQIGVVAIAYAGAILPNLLTMLFGLIGLLLGLSMASQPVNQAQSYWMFVLSVEAVSTPFLTLVCVFGCWLIFRSMKANRTWKRALGAYFAILGFEYLFMVIGMMCCGSLQQ